MTRFGAVPVMVSGFAVLALAGILAALAPHDSVPILALALLLLGRGWSLGFVAGSSLLARGDDAAERVRLQGTTDTIVWSSAALASITAGALLNLVGYATLGLITTAFLIAPTAAILLGRRSAVEPRAGSAAA